MRSRRPAWMAPAAVLALSAAAFAGCDSRTPRIEARAVTLHVPSECAPEGAAYAQYYAYGDFQPTAESPASEGHFVSDEGVTLSQLPANARTLVVDVSQDVGRWRGLAGVGEAGDVDVLLWPSSAPCALSGGLGARQRASLGVLDHGHVLVVGGSSGGTVPATLVADLKRGTLRPLVNGLLSPRVAATVTAFAGGGLVAGGESPDAHQPLATAEVYVQRTDTDGDFDSRIIPLSEPRSAHAAAVLASGETLLVGGVGEGGRVLRSLEVIDPVTRRARTAGLVSLAVARRGAQAIRLASGEVLVAGGVDAAGDPVPTLEWLSPDAGSTSKEPRDLVTGQSRAFVALAGGGALAVVAPTTATSQGFKSVWVISEGGVLEDAVPVEGLSDVQLFAGDEGSPLLWTGDRWLRFRPWSGDFEPLPDLLSASGPAESEAVVSPDPGLALWVRPTDGDTRLFGYRFGVRDLYASDPPVRPYLTSASGTAMLAPDRLVVDATQSLHFDSATGLHLVGGASAFVTDATFADCDVDMQLGDGPLARLVLRDDGGHAFEVGSPECPFTGNRLRVRRQGSVVGVVSDPDAHCTSPFSPDARIQIGVRGPGEQGEAVVRSLSITRR